MWRSKGALVSSQIGRTILQRQEAESWGSGVIGRLADDLRAEFPEMKGLSRSNLFYMRGFAAAWTEPIVQEPFGQLPWGHITVLLDQLDTHDHRLWYASAAVEYGWSRNVLMNMIMNKTLERTGAAPSNFAQQLVAPDSELAQQVAKDPYNFEFLGLAGEVAERDLENALTSRITETRRKLGPGFSFVGRQVAQRRRTCPQFRAERCSPRTLATMGAGSALCGLSGGMENVCLTM